MLTRLNELLYGTLRRRLIVGVALVHAVLMTMFIWDLNTREQNILLGQQTTQATALAKSLSTSSAIWLAARDLNGLQEVVEAQRGYPEILFAMILTPDGQVMAHTDRTLLGKYVTDLPVSNTIALLSLTDTLVDVVTPVWLNNRQIGFARVGLGQQGIQAQLASIKRDGILYALAAIAIGILLANLLGKRLTHRLHILQVAADAVRSGNAGQRAIMDGTDEAAQLAHEFNDMLDTLAQREQDLHVSQQALRLSEERFELATRGANDGIWDWNLLDNTVYFSPRWKEMIGYKADELTNTLDDWASNLHPDDIDIAMAAIKANHAGESDLYEISFRFRHKDGHYIWILARGRTIHDESGKPLRMTGTHIDFTARKNDEAQLQLAARVFENTAEGIFVIDQNAHILEVNRAYCDITGFTHEELMDYRFDTTRSGRHDAAFHQELWRTLNQTGRWSGEVWCLRKNDEIFPTWLNINAVPGSKDQPLRYIGVFSDISALKDAETKLHHMAYSDYLTGLPNRLLFADRLSHDITICQRQNTRLALLFIDLDRFKCVNDSLGHEAGDVLLIEVANRLRTVVRSSDTVARLGGDEFTVILRDISSATEVAYVARNIISEINKKILVSGEYVHVGSSIGISLYPDDGETNETLTRHADMAMYQAKEAGGNQFHSYSEALQTRSREYLALESDLHQALEREQLVLHYQPIVDAISGAVAGGEALVRWQHPQHGLLPPNRFIPLAEENGMILPIGAWVIRNACQQIKAWQTEGLAPPLISINLSARQFRQHDLTEKILAILDETGTPASSLELEITESVAMENANAATATLLALNGEGFLISIDDFGTGYSSLGYLKQFPIQKLKIDCSFVRDISSDPNDAAIASAVIQMGHSLGMKIVAEGVETEAQQAFLREQGCDLLQGFLHSKPLTGKAFADFLRAHGVHSS